MLGKSGMDGVNCGVITHQFIKYPDIKTTWRQERFISSIVNPIQGDQEGPLRGRKL